jgi:monovalent cation:H+ antiporter-2, CPA2 family
MSDPAFQEDSLRSAPFFADLAAEDLQGILRIARPESFAAGEAIVRQGDAGDGMYLLVEGAAEVDVGGRFHRLAPGDFFGEMALVSSRKRIATVTATEPVRALVIPPDAFRSFVLEHPRVALSMLEAVVERLREVEQRIDAWMA